MLRTFGIVAFGQVGIRPVFSYLCSLRLNEQTKPMNHKPLIFITNDDGVRAKGLQKLIESCCPASGWIRSGGSGRGAKRHVARHHDDAPAVPEKGDRAGRLDPYGCNGTPVDCVKIAFDYLLQNGETPDLVLSGINHGANSAVNVLYSGTMEPPSKAVSTTFRRSASRCSTTTRTPTSAPCSSTSCRSCEKP